MALGLGDFKIITRIIFKKMQSVMILLCLHEYLILGDQFNYLSYLKVFNYCEFFTEQSNYLFYLKILIIVRFSLNIPVIYFKY